MARDDFQWSYTQEPHASRRREIMKKYPEIKELFGIDPSFKYVVSALVITQIIACYLLRDSDWLLILLEAYFFGGLVNHALTLAIHDISHNVAFGNDRPLANRLFGMWANLPIAVPFSISFKKYHIEHHRYLGEDGLDTDLPTPLEAKLFNSAPARLLWLALQPVFYAFRPIIVYKKTPTDMEILNFIVQIGFDLIMLYFCGWKSLAYLLFGTFIALGLHPSAGHFISEHYIFTGDQETSSYYGIMNYVLFDVGYHVEHHDFPYIPSRSLHLVREIAPEYYSNLMHHTSWTTVLWRFVTDAQSGPRARVKRAPRVAQKTDGHWMLDEYINALLVYIGYYEVKTKLISMCSSCIDVRSWMPAHFNCDGTSVSSKLAVPQIKQD